MGWLLRNWHLKLAALAVATVLYTGLVFSGTFAEEAVQVRIEQANVSRDAFVLSGDLGLVEVRYRVANDQAVGLTDADFTARVDMAEYDMDRAPEPQQLPIEVTALRDGVEVLSWEPREVRVEIDRIEVRSVPVEVDPGEIPDGLEIDDPVLSVSEVEVRGPASFVERVDHAVAFISIPASGIDVNEAVDLIAVDISDQPIESGLVELDPETVSVQVAVDAIETQTTVAVSAEVSGTPAPGFALDALRVEPATVTIVGLPEDLTEIGSVLTEPISIDGASSSQTFEVALQLPDGIALGPGEDEVVSVEATIVPSVSSRTFIVGVVCEGAPDDAACLPQVEQLAITVSGSGNALSSLTAAAITPVVDVSGLEPGTYTLTPSLEGLPAGIEVLGVSPGLVTVTVTAPEPSPSAAP